jgi:hypothetical protein
METVSYMVVESGAHTLSDGTRIVAGETNVDHRFSPVTLTSLTRTPIVLATVASQVGASAVTPRLRNVTGTGFEVRLHEEQNNDGAHPLETVNYVAIEPGAGSTGGTPFIAGNTTASHVTANVVFGSPMNAAPALFANIQSYVGGDTSALRYRTLNADGFSIFLEEEQSKDREVNHVAEDIGYFAIPVGLLSTSSIGGSAGIHRGEFVAAQQDSERSKFQGLDHQDRIVDVKFALLALEGAEWFDSSGDAEDFRDFKIDRLNLNSVDAFFENAIHVRDI